MDKNTRKRDYSQQINNSNYPLQQRHFSTLLYKKKYNLYFSKDILYFSKNILYVFRPIKQADYQPITKTVKNKKNQLILTKKTRLSTDVILSLSKDLIPSNYSLTKPHAEISPLRSR